MHGELLMKSKYITNTGSIIFSQTLLPVTVTCGHLIARLPFLTSPQPPNLINLINYRRHTHFDSHYLRFKLD